MLQIQPGLTLNLPALPMSAASPFILAQASTEPAPALSAEEIEKKLQEAEAAASVPAAEATAPPPAEAAAASEPQPGAESTAPPPVEAAGASDPATEAAATPPAEAAAASADTSATVAPDASATPATVTEVSAEAVQEATDSGKDVVVADSTTAEEQALIEEARTATLAAAAALETQEPETVDAAQVVTAESTRSSGDEATPTAAAASEADDDDNQVWKYLGAAAAGAVVGALIPTLGGKLVQDQGDRVIVEREGELYVHKDENLLLRRPGVTVQTERFAGGIVRDTVTRENGSRVVTVRDAGGFVLKRTRVLPDGREIVLIDETRYGGGNAPASGTWERTLPARHDAMPRERYIVDASRANRGTVRETLMAPPVQDAGRFFTLREVRDNERVRALMPRIDLDTIHFALGSAAIHPSQAEGLTMVGNSMANVIAENPREMFLIEGHTDAVGSNLMNLALSDRRAEAVALALTEYFAIPPENLLVQGYGERYLKVDTQSANQANRRATVRRITPLIDGDFHAAARR